MTYLKAIATCKKVNDPDISDNDKLDAIEKILSMETINAVNKDTLLGIVRWFWDRCVEEVPHDKR